ncbi:MAG TPA: glycosyltransferase family 2 protein [Methylophilaceae bacterium]|nr:glycosyltransferase family 2 protein [Methylophilaceae bacterium]
MISVCLACFEGSQFIEQQLNSILSQLSENDEVVISDDGSTDDTVAIVNNINDNRIIWAGIGGKHGVVKNFERALQYAKGDFIFLADQDDLWLPGKVNACLDLLKSNMLVVTDCNVVDGNLREIKPSFFKVRRSGPGFVHNVLVNSYLGCCMAFRRELLDVALPIPEKTPMHDMWLGLIAEKLGKVVFLDQPYLLYRRHQHNATAMTGESKLSVIGKIKYRLVLIGLLANRLFLCSGNKR